MITQRNSWHSKIGFILASAGSAVGLGAIWRFPYVTAEQGGGAFLFLFILFSFILGLALLLIEIAIGRSAQKGAVSAFRTLGGKPWAFLGYLSVLGGFIVYSFYSIVGGWTLMYLYQSLQGKLLSTDLKTLEHNFSAYISDAPSIITTQALYILLTFTIVFKGIQSGIERASKILMPALFVIMLILIARSLTLDGAMSGVVKFLIPDWSKTNGTMIVEALGLSIFSLSLGVGAMLAYGSYVNKEVDIVHASQWITLLSVIVALLAGLMILPAVSASGLDPKSGPGLTFMIMPIIFAKMPMGSLFAVVFFALLVVAALTSSMAMLELLIVFAVEELGLSRRSSSIIMSLLVFIAGIPAALSFGIWSDIQPLGENKVIFDLMADGATNILMPLSCMGTALFAGWFSWNKLSDQWHNLPCMAQKALRIICQIFAPFVIMIVMYYALS